MWHINLRAWCAVGPTGEPETAGSNRVIQSLCRAWNSMMVLLAVLYIYAAL
jgi:hypothetical protein